PRRVGPWRAGTTTALVVGALAVVVPLAASPALAGMKLDAIPFDHGGTKNGGGSGSGGTGGVDDVAGVGALNLIDNMKAVLSSQSDLIMFTATSRTPTYWQVATLTKFNGTSWVPDPATKAAADGAPQLSPVAPPVLPTPSAGRTFNSKVTIVDLRSNLLPAPPSTLSTGGATVVQVEPGIGLVQPFANPEELAYTTVARSAPTNLAAASSPTMAALVTSAPAPDLAPYLALPSTVPASVVRLAHEIVARDRTPAAKATALVRYFTAGKRFHYTLSPPAEAGTNPLVSFLFSTHAGFCQQFAGAFAVLARLDGLPTRLAIGFTTGSAAKGDNYQITGADAHSWPQVYLGAGAGWVSFEPTPATTEEILGTGVLNGAATTTPPSRPPAVTTTTLSDRRLNGTGIKPGVGSKGLGLLIRPAGTPARPAHWGTVVLIALGSVVLVAAATFGGPWLWRRRRPRLRRRPFARAAAPRAEILIRWEQAAAVLERTGLGRHPTETLDEHARRVVTSGGRPDRSAEFLPVAAGGGGAGTAG
ncbi:MAG: transglutaminaseTgpA domain-containing protein, partial [Acidimicrobiales bacterium]